jgi:hypothetical protein
MQIDGLGRVGIGTSPGSYNANLAVYSAGGAFATALHSNSGTFPKVSAISLGSDAVSYTYTTGGTTVALTGSAHIAALQSASSGAGTDIAFINTAGGGVFEKVRITSDGKLLVGTSSSVRSGLLEVAKATADTQIQITESSDSGDGPTLRMTRTRGSSLSSPTPVQDGNFLGRIRFDSYDTAAYRTGAAITANADGQTWASGDCPTRLVFSTTADGASSPTERMRIQSDGNISIGSAASTTYRCALAVASGADRDIFLGGISGASNGFQVNWLHATTALSVKFNSITTTASAANAFLDSADGNRIYRSTSSLRYKKNVENIDQLKADAILSLRPVWYRSKASNDRQDWSWYGLIAEEVAQVEPRLVHWTYLDEDYETETVNGEIKKTLKEGAQQVPDGVQYDRLTVLLLDVVRRQQQAIETLEAKVAALESQ